MSDTNHTIQKHIAHLERQLTKVLPDSWTAQKLNESLEYYRKQLALSRDQRLQYKTGTI